MDVYKLMKCLMNQMFLLYMKVHIHTTIVNVWVRNREKHLAPSCTPVGEGACQPDSFTKSSWGCELSYDTSPLPCMRYVRWC